MGSIALTAPDSWGSLAGATLNGGVINGFNGGFQADQTSWYAGVTVPLPITGLKVGASYDYLGISDQSLSNAKYANATAVYASFQATEKLTLFARGEYASSTDGFVLGTASKVIAGTATAQYDLWKNVISRIEFRWDHAADGSKAYGGSEVGDPDLKNSYILLANLIYKF
jgi:hypothetical protein